MILGKTSKWKIVDFTTHLYQGEMVYININIKNGKAEGNFVTIMRNKNQFVHLMNMTEEEAIKALEIIARKDLARALVDFYFPTTN